MFSSGAMLSFQQNRKLLRRRTFLNKEDNTSSGKIAKSNVNEKLQRNWKEEKFDKMQREANTKAIGFLFIAMLLIAMSGYLLVQFIL